MARIALSAADTSAPPMPDVRGVAWLLNSDSTEGGRHRGRVQRTISGDASRWCGYPGSCARLAQRGCRRHATGSHLCLLAPRFRGLPQGSPSRHRAGTFAAQRNPAWLRRHVTTSADAHRDKPKVVGLRFQHFRAGCLTNDIAPRLSPMRPLIAEDDRLGRQPV